FFDGEASGQTFSEGGQIGDSADGFDFFAAGEFFGKGDDIDGATGIDEFRHAGEDALMRVEGEVFGTELFGGLVEGVVVEQNGAEDGALGVNRCGQAALEGDVRLGCHGV